MHLLTITVPSDLRASNAHIAALAGTGNKYFARLVEVSDGFEYTWSIVTFAETVPSSKLVIVMRLS